MRLLHFFPMLLLACATEGEAARSEDDALVGGEAAGDRFPATVKLTLPEGATCGAAKIGARRFLTAAHCITHGYVEVDSTVMIGRGAPAEPVPATVLKLTTAPIDAEPPGPGREVLSEQMGFDAAVFEVDIDTPDVGIATFDRTPLAVGDEVVVSGAGCTEDQRSRPAGPDVVRGAFRFAIVKIESVEKYHYFLEATDRDGRPGRVCPGDSGTPVYRTDASGRYTKVVGVNSFRALVTTPPIWSSVTRLDTGVPADAKRWLDRARVFPPAR